MTTLKHIERLKMKYRIILSSLLIASAFSLAGCQEEQKALYASPSVTEVGTFDGCNVKFVNRGFQTESFFLARCDGTTATTNNAMVGSKSQTLQRRVAIETQIKDLEKERDAIKARESAIQKLSQEEAKALGVQ